jgi:hypothetical protein
MFSRRIGWAVITILALALAACGAQAGTVQDIQIKPIEDILVSGPEFVNVGAQTATLQLKVSQPLVCAVVYGETKQYGQMATDPGMGGVGTTDHTVLLSGLKPDTLYYARFQGVVADGTLYRSQDYTFHTTPATESANGPNLALPENGATLVGVSSNYGGGANDSTFGALKAIDGDPATAWSSNGDGDNAWIEIELAAKTHVTKIGFWTRTMGTSAQIESFQIVTDTGETVGPFDLTYATQSYLFDTDFVAKRLRFEAVKTSGGNTGAVEIEVYGQPQG